MQLGKERGAGPGQLLRKRELARAQWIFRQRHNARGQQDPELIGQKQGDAPIMLTQRIEPDPGYFAGSD